MIKNLKMELMLLLSVMVAGCILSCSKEYDLSDSDRLDKTITVGGDGFIFPLGSTEKMTLTKLVDTTGFHNLKKDSEGNYFLEFSQNFHQSASFLDFTEELNLEGVSKEMTSNPYLIPVVPEFLLPDIISIPFSFEDGFNFTISFEDAAKNQGLKRIDSLTLSNAKLYLDAKVISTGSLPDPTIVTFEMVIPERYKILGGKFRGDTLILKGDLNSEGRIYFDDITIRSVHLDDVKDLPFEYTDRFVVANLGIEFSKDQYYKLAGQTVSYSISTGLEGGQADGNSIFPENFYGLVDRRIDEVRQVMEIEDVPDFMREQGSDMDFYNPYFKIEFVSNLGIPMIADMSFLPIIGPNPVYDKEIEFSLTSLPSPSPEEMVYNNFWISNTDTDVQPGYQWIQADIPSIIRIIPDSIRMVVSPRTDTDVPQHVLNCRAQYNLEADCDFVVPFSLGPNFQISFKDTIQDLPDILVTALTNNTVELEGSIENGFPMKFELSISLLDENMNPLNITSNTQEVAAWEGVGEPVVTPLDITLQKNPLAEKAKQMVLNFKALSGPTPGIPVSDKSYLVAVLKLAVPGGITINLDEE